MKFVDAIHKKSIKTVISKVGRQDTYEIDIIL